jgi:hypothetical protein
VLTQALLQQVRIIAAHKLELKQKHILASCTAEATQQASLPRNDAIQFPTFKVKFGA